MWVGSNKQSACLGPSLETAFQVFGVCAGMAQPGGDALAQLEPAPTDNRDRFAGKFIRPGCNATMIAPNTCRKHARIGAVILIRADIQN